MLGSFSKVRVRLVMGFTVAFISMAIFGAVSYQHFAQMELKLHYLANIDNLLNNVLEVRRYEKNYLLYKHEKDYKQALTYLNNFDQLLSQNQGHISENSGAKTYTRFKKLSQDYQNTLKQLHSLIVQNSSSSKKSPTDTRKTSLLTQNLRTFGKKLIARSENLAVSERNNMQGLLRNYQPMLIFFLACLAIIGLAMVYLLLVRLVRPLSTIEQATNVVELKDLNPIQTQDRKDEIGSLINAFNHMVIKLKTNNEKMIQTEKLTSLGTLTSGVAHELNNPLNNISTSCQIILEECNQNFDPYHKELLKAIDEQVEKARKIVSSLLEFSRQRKFELNLENLKEVIQESLLLIKGEITASLQVKVRVPESIILPMDKAHMVQALLNLIQNAIQATPQKGLITISAQEQADLKQVQLIIEDNGSGIDPTFLPKVFDPFFTTKKIGNGTGLGLSITYGIIERHQGQIKVTSSPQKGTKFTITLPLKAKRN